MTYIVYMTSMDVMFGPTPCLSIEDDMVTENHLTSILCKKNYFM